MHVYLLNELGDDIGEPPAGAKAAHADLEGSLRARLQIVCRDMKRVLMSLVCLELYTCIRDEGEDVT
jgi:hypothetical protein